MAHYFAHITTTGPIKYRQVPDAIGVLETPDNPEPIGNAFCTGWNAAGLAVWRLTVRTIELPGRWVIVDREFRRVEG